MPIAEDGSVVPESFYKRPPPGYDRAEGLRRATRKAARRLGEQTARLVADVPATRTLIATVKTVMANQASDGNAVVLVSWRDSVLAANGYGSTYTPVVGHRVLCLLVDGQLIVVDRVIGAP